MMQYCDVAAVLLLLLILIVLVYPKLMKKSGMRNRMTDMTSSSEADWGGFNASNPYGVLNNQLDGIRGKYGGDIGRKHPLAGKGLLNHYRSGDSKTPRDMRNDFLSNWFGADESEEKKTEEGKKESMVSGAVSDESEISDAAAIGAADAAASLGISTCQDDKLAGQLGTGDYNAYVTEVIADDRMLQNHAEWVKEVKPFSQTSMVIREFDIEPSINFVGLRRPQAVAVYNPTQLTELSPEDLAPNPKFDFRG
jgi:hypothetical protein